MQTIKLVAVGDGAVGKTCMLITYTTNKFPTQYVPTIFDNYAAEIPVGKDTYLINLFDTAGQEDYDRLRPMSYPDTDIFLICFSVIDPNSFENVKKRWIPEILEYNKKAHFMIIGTQVDLRKDEKTVEKLAKQNLAPVTADQGVKLAKDIKAIQYVECSALTQVYLKINKYFTVKHDLN